MATLQELQQALQNVDEALKQSPDDPVLQKEANQLADAVIQMTGPRTAIEQAKFSDETNPQYVISPQNIALGTAIGSVVGGAEAALTRGALTIGKGAWNVIKGGTTGGASTTAGELTREATNNSPTGQIWALGAELATGVIPTLAGDVISRLPGPALTAIAGYKTGKTAQAITGRSESDIAARNKIFGYSSMKEGVASDIFRVQQEALDRQYLGGLGIQVANNEVPKDVLRSKLYEVFDNNSFLNSPEYTDALKRLRDGVTTNFVKKEDVNTLTSLVRGQGAKDPIVAKSWNERFLNTIQQASPEWNGVKISDGASTIMKEAIDNFTQRVSGTPMYSTLKSIEEKGYTAKARDSLPVLLNQEFKGPAVEKALANLAKSPEGRNDFRIALTSYLKDLPEQEALSRFNDLYPMIVKTKSMDLGELSALKGKVAKFVSKGYIQKTGDISGTALKASVLRGIAPAEVANRVFSDKNDALKPFSM